jgi:hypothetical protein
MRSVLLETLSEQELSSRQESKFDDSVVAVLSDVLSVSNFHMPRQRLFSFKGTARAETTTAENNGQHLRNDRRRKQWTAPSAE